MGLSDTQQGILMFFAFVLPALSVWLGAGAPTDRTALSLLGANFVGGIMAWIKEQLGGQAPSPNPSQNS